MRVAREPSPCPESGDGLDDMNRRQIIIGAIGLSGAASAQPGACSRLIGVWKLRSCLRTFKDGRTDLGAGIRLACGLREDQVKIGNSG
jgi:hypothetical protein